MPPVFEVIKPGMFSTVQDGGFGGFRSFGIPTGGAVDLFSLRVANILVSNDQFAAGLEITVKGPKLRALNGAAIAITGGDLSPLLNGNPLPMWETVFVEEGDVIDFGGRRTGCRCYLALSGGIDVPVVLGAKSTNTRMAIGGIKGRPLRKGDVIKMTKGSGKAVSFLELPPEKRPVYGTDVTLRILPGPHFKLFSRRAVDDFVGAKFTVSERMDRMGVVLIGKPFDGTPSELVSQPVTPGAVQILPGGEPVILLAEAQTIGGYAHIGTVINADLDLAGQLFPGDKVGFMPVSMEEAVSELLRKEEKSACVQIKRTVRRYCRTAKNSYEIIWENKKSP